MAMAQGSSIRIGKNHTKEKERVAKSVQLEEKERELAASAMVKKKKMWA